MLPKKISFFTAPEHRLTAVNALLLFGVWLLFLILALRTFGSESVYTNYHSDAAIPILQSNSDRPITIYDHYYYGADRWGGWPMMVAKWLHLNTGLHWNDQRIHYARTTWIFLGLLFLAALNARAALAVMASALLVLCLEPTVRRLMFDLSQLYAWQVTPLFMAWFCLRQVLAQRFRVLWGVAFYFCAFFACWSSVASGPLLIVLLTLEALSSYLSVQRIFNKRAIGAAVLLLLAAVASELLIKKNYHRYCLKHFGNDNVTPMFLDFAYLSRNLVRNWQNIVQFSLFPLIVVALFFIVIVGILLVYARVARKQSLMTRLISLADDKTFVMIVALTAMAAANFAIMVSVSHVRVDFYDVRFHTLTYLFASIAGLLTIFLVIRLLSDRFAVTRYVVPLVLAGAFVFLGVNFPPRESSELYRLHRQAALDLAQKAPGAMLMGGYWETYVFAGLQPTNTMTPLPIEGVLNRIPWTQPMLSDADQVVVEYRHSGIEDRKSVPRELRQYGNVLKLQDGHFYENGPYQFALYTRERTAP